MEGWIPKRVKRTDKRRPFLFDSGRCVVCGCYATAQDAVRIGFHSAGMSYQYPQGVAIAAVRCFCHNRT